MSRGGYSHQATQGSNSGAQDRDDHRHSGRDGVGRVQSSSQNNRLTAQDLRDQDSQNMQGTYGQGSTHRTASGAGYQGYQQNQTQVPYYTRGEQANQQRYGGREVDRRPDPDRGQPVETPYYENQRRGQYAPQQQQQQQPQPQYGHSTQRYTQQPQSDDPYGSYGNDARQRSARACLEDFDRNMEEGR